jgi:diguanylate cyclase (GGDEF)-like protein
MALSMQLLEEYKANFVNWAQLFYDEQAKKKHGKHLYYHADKQAELLKQFEENVSALGKIMRVYEPNEEPILDRFKLASAASCASIIAQLFSVDEEGIKADGGKASIGILQPNEYFAYFVCLTIIEAFNEISKPLFYNLPNSFGLKMPKNLYHYHENEKETLSVMFDEVMARCFNLYKKTKDDGDEHDYFSLYAIAIFLCMVDVSSDSIQLPVLKNLYYRGQKVKKGEMGHDVLLPIVRDNVRRLYRDIRRMDKKGIVEFRMREDNEDDFVEITENRLKSHVLFYEREYFSAEEKNNEHVYLYAYVKSILHEQVFKVNEVALTETIRYNKELAVLAQPNEYLCWYILFDAHCKAMRSEKEGLTPYFGPEHCADHMAYTLGALEKSQSGRLMEVSISLVQYLLTSMIPFHKVSTAGLTEKLLARHAFSQTLEEYCRESENVGLIMLDIDFFKQQNEHFGHSHGDKVLLKVADVLVDVVKEYGSNETNAVVSRHGGEEFNIAFKNIGKEKLIEAAKSINEKLNDIERCIDYNHKVQFPCAKFMSASIGCSVLPSLVGLDKDAIVKRLGEYFNRIDTEALGYVKLNGRNNFCYIDLR